MSFLKKIYQSTLKYFGLLGLTFFTAAATTAVTAKAADPAIGIGGIAAKFYGTFARNTVTNLLPGTGIILSEIFRLVTDVIAPGVGTALGPVFHAVAAKTEVANTAVMAADILSPSV